MHVASARDNNPVWGSCRYYGVISEIWLLNYTIFEVPMFKCDWVDINHGSKVDELGFTLVQLDKIGPTNDPFILASQAKQVFYVQDQLDSKWHVVLFSPQKEYLHEEEDDGFNDYCVDHIDASQELPGDKFLAEIDPSDSFQVRKGVQGIWVEE